MKLRLRIAVGVACLALMFGVSGAAVASLVSFTQIPVGTTAGQINSLIPGTLLFPTGPSFSGGGVNPQDIVIIDAPGEVNTHALFMSNYPNIADLVYLFPQPVDFVEITFTPNPNGSGISYLTQFFAQAGTLQEISTATAVQQILSSDPIPPAPYSVTYSGSAIEAFSIDSGINGPHMYIKEIAFNVVPLPAALPLFLSALGALGFVGWRRRQA